MSNYSHILDSWGYFHLAVNISIASNSVDSLLSHRCLVKWLRYFESTNWREYWCTHSSIYLKNRTCMVFFLSWAGITKGDTWWCFLGSKHADVSSSGVAAFIGFATQAKPVGFGCQRVGMPGLGSRLSTYWKTKFPNKWQRNPHTSVDQTPIPCVTWIKTKREGAWRAVALALLNIHCYINYVHKLSPRLVAGLRHVPYKERLLWLVLHSLKWRRLPADLIIAFNIFTGLLASHLPYSSKVLQSPSRRQRGGSSNIGISFLSPPLRPSLLMTSRKDCKKFGQRFLPHKPPFLTDLSSSQSPAFIPPVCINHFWNIAPFPILSS